MEDSILHIAKMITFLISVAQKNLTRTSAAVLVRVSDCDPQPGARTMAAYECPSCQLLSQHVQCAALEGEDSVLSAPFFGKE